MHIRHGNVVVLQFFVVSRRGIKQIKKLLVNLLQTDYVCLRIIQHFQDDWIPNVIISILKPHIVGKKS